MRHDVFEEEKAEGREPVWVERVWQGVWQTERPPFDVSLLPEAQVSDGKVKESDAVLFQPLQTASEVAKDRLPNLLRVLQGASRELRVDGRKAWKNCGGLFDRPHRSKRHIRTVECKSLYNIRECVEAREASEMVELLRAVCAVRVLGRVS